MRYLHHHPVVAVLVYQPNFGYDSSKKNDTAMKHEVKPDQTINLVGCNYFVTHSLGFIVACIRVFWIFTSPCSVKCASSIQKMVDNLLKIAFSSCHSLLVSHSCVSGL
ncbi:hypothetical protein TNIN_164961 [Trichonephila inaurata madagascariensis]|uniref:Uncharacterized protein n=1 Tax=Trichonephila inaurata madagascariensis TaxID=2747483 RepID=A0A8X6WLF1_9ARAC|nr:hypothetical protein TNIN_164961 [Trichonephila inaurata madagascariensis]